MSVDLSSVLVIPSEEVKRFVLGEVGTTENQLKEDTAKLRDWLVKQPHLPHSASDGILQSFILGCKNSLEKAKERLDSYYSVRTIYPSLFSDRDPAHFYKPDVILQYLIPEITNDGCRLFILQNPKDSDNCNFDHLSVIRRQLAITDLTLNHQPYISNIIAVYDMQGTTASFITKWSLQYHIQAMRCFQDTLPLRIKKIIVLNCLPFLVSLFDTLIKPLVKDKLRERVLLTTESDLMNFLPGVPKEFVPTDLGGAGPSSAEMHEKWDKVIQGQREWFLNEQNLKSDESRRPGKPKTIEENNFGVEGSFRSLAID